MSLTNISSLPVWEMVVKTKGHSFTMGKATRPETRKFLENLGFTSEEDEPIQVDPDKLANRLGVESSDLISYARSEIRNIDASRKKTSSTGRPTPGMLASNAPAVQKRTAWDAVASKYSDDQVIGTWIEEIRDHKTMEFTKPNEISSIVEQAISVYRKLPTDTPTPLSVFALTAVGDPHGLDYDHTLGKMVLQLLAVQNEVSIQRVSISVVRRELLEIAGLTTDTVSAPVMIAGFSPSMKSVAGVTARLNTSTGLVSMLTPESLENTYNKKVRWVTPGQAVFVVENPTVITAMVQEFGNACPPVVCTQGNPDSATITVGTWRFLRELSEQGANLLVHADFDRQGIRLVNRIVNSIPRAKAWKMGHKDYELVINKGATVNTGKGVPKAVWDDKLVITMQDKGLAGYEEGQLPELLRSLKNYTKSSFSNKLIKKIFA